MRQVQGCAMADAPTPQKKALLCLQSPIGFAHVLPLQGSRAGTALRFCQTCMLIQYVFHMLQSTSWPSNLGSRAATSDHVSLPFTRLEIAFVISSKLALTCSVESRSRNVKVLSLTDWKSIVIPRGVPSSSLRFSDQYIYSFSVKYKRLTE
jgi:hypothetical protein